MLALKWLGSGLLVCALVACGGKVVFVEADDDGQPSDGGSPPVSDLCESLCQNDIGCAFIGSGSCLDWCAERLSIAGECAPDFQPVAECLAKNPASKQSCSIADACPAESDVYEACVLGCGATPSCEAGPNQTVCRVTCANDFEWTCTQGFPETCTCAIDGKVLGTCVAQQAGSFAVCCDGMFAASQ